MQTWKHTGFNADWGRSIPPENRAEREQICQYILRNPFSEAKVTLEHPKDTVIYRSRLNPKINRNFQIFDCRRRFKTRFFAGAKLDRL